MHVTCSRCNSVSVGNSKMVYVRYIFDRCIMNIDFNTDVKWDRMKH